MQGRRGFTLVELVVVILILGILAGVAAPRMFDTSARATDNTLKQTLSIVRDAIELYTADVDTNPNPGSPPAWTNSAAFHTAMSKYIRGTFPNCPVGAAGLKGTNAVISSATTTGATGAWRYDPLTGSFAVNFAGATASDATVNYDGL